jgi:lipid-A-disaccharide synthase-like uncharacterized protein
MENYWFFALGFTAQALFSARMLVQWILSEKLRKVVSPVIYWQLSLLASFLFFIYGWLRADFAIILGQLFSYYIYIWNLNIQNYWKKIHVVFRTIILLTPAIISCMLLVTGKGSIERLWTEMSLGLLIFGSIGQVIFTFRFIYQWWYSRRLGASVLPNGFWILSMAGSLCIVLYGIYRRDPVLTLGQLAGFLTYSRNLFLNKKNKYEDIGNR